MPEVLLDRVSKTPSTHFAIPHWKLIECGSQLPRCALEGDWVPASPIQELCTTLNDGKGKTCQFDSQADESHIGCMSSQTGISKCRDWFNDLSQR